MTVATRLLLDRRRSFMWWAIGVVGLVLFTVALYPSIEGDERLEDFAQDIVPEAMRSMAGLNDVVPITSAPGYLHSRIFSIFLPLVLLIFGIGLGARAIAGIEQDGTLELLLANPVTRRRVAAERYGASMALLAALATVFTLALLVAAPLFGALEGVSLPGLIAAGAGAFGLAALHSTIAFTAGAATGRRATAIAAAASIAVAGYLIQGFLHIVPALHPFRFAIPWHWYLGRNMLAHGVALEAIITPLVLAALLATAGVAAFKRRDLHT